MKEYKIKENNLSNPLHFNYCNVEGTIIPISINGEKKILKVFKENCDYLENKWSTIKSLEQAKEYFDDRFILPEMLAVTNKTIGYIMKYVNNINMETLLQDYNVPLIKKIQCLKEMCMILEECQKLRKQCEELSNFYIGDLHVNNLLFNLNTKKINICDMDSCSIGNNKPFVYRYLSCSKALTNLDNKYKKINGKYIPNENSDIYCATMIILDFLYSGPVEMMQIDEFYKYINYLDSLRDNGNRLFDKDLLYAFSLLYDQKNNINPIDLIDTISEKALLQANNVSYYYSKIKTYQNSYY